MYQVENSRILHVTKKATGRKIIVYKSNCVVKERLVMPRLNHFMLAEVFVCFWDIKRIRGGRDIKNAIFTAFLVVK